MSNKKQNEELQSRREFFKKAAKAALPVVGAVVMASMPNVMQAAEEMGCDWGCSGSCWSSCQSSCRGTCASGCTGTCTGGCKAACSNGCNANSGGWY
jgi:CXXX repeat radical SAM target protein